MIITLEIVTDNQFQEEIADQLTLSRSGDAIIVDQEGYKEWRIPFDSPDKAYDAAWRIDNHTAEFEYAIVFIDGKAYDCYRDPVPWADK